MESTSPSLIQTGRYRHFKGGEYEVFGVAKDSETEQLMVVYRTLYGDHGMWVRPLSEFTETIEREGVTQPRFAYVPPQYTGE